MLSLCARRASRQCPHAQLLVVHTRSASSLIDLAPLRKRTLGFSNFARKVTNDPLWDFVSLLRSTADPNDPLIRDALRIHRIPQFEWSKWSPVVYSPSFQHAVDIIHRYHVDKSIPHWVILALACHKVRSSSDAESLLFDLTIPLTSSKPSLPPVLHLRSPGLIVLTAHSLAHFTLVPLLRPLSSHFLDFPMYKFIHTGFYFNMFLQAASNFRKSREASNVTITVLEEMQRRGLPLWSDTERVLIRSDFVTTHLIAHLHERGPPPKDRGAEKRKRNRLEAWLRGHSTLGNVQESEQYLNAIREYCLENGLTPPYPTDDTPINGDDDGTRVQGSAQKANSEFLRAMRKSQPSAFRYFNHLLSLDLAKPDQPPPSSSIPPPSSSLGRTPKTNVDIYDWTTALHAGASDDTLSADDFLDLFESVKLRYDSYRPTRATYTVMIRGLMRKRAHEEALKLWEEFVTDAVSAHEETDSNRTAAMQIDRYALSVGVDVLMQNGRPIEALYLIEQAIKADMEKMTASPIDSNSEPPEVAPSSSSDISSALTLKPFTYITTDVIHVLFRSLLKTHRPDVIFYIWAHLTSLYFVSPTNKMLQMLLKAAIQASQIDGISVKGAMRWYFADNNIFSKRDEPITPTPNPDLGTVTTEHRESGESGDDGSSHNDTLKTTATSASDSPPSRESLTSHLRTLFVSPPSLVGIWAGRRATDVARSIFRGMILGNWPALNEVSTKSRDKSSFSVWPELSRMFRSSTLVMPTGPTPVGTERPKHAKQDESTDPLGPPLLTIHPSEETFFTYISLLGLTARAEEIPEVLVWMRALGIVPRTQTLSVALVFWAEVGLRGPLFEDDGWIGAMDWWRKTDPSASGSGSDAPSGSGSTGDAPKTEYAALRAWILDWVGEKRSPTEADIQSAMMLVARMRIKTTKQSGPEQSKT